MSVYIENGYKNRKDYLNSLCEDYGVSTNEEMELLKAQIEAHLEEIETLRAIIMERDDTIIDLLSDLDWNQCYND